MPSFLISGSITNSFNWAHFNLNHIQNFLFLKIIEQLYVCTANSNITKFTGLQKARILHQLFFAWKYAVWCMDVFHCYRVLWWSLFFHFRRITLCCHLIFLQQQNNNPGNLNRSPNLIITPRNMLRRNVQVKTVTHPTWTPPNRSSCICQRGAGPLVAGGWIWIWIFPVSCR